MSTVVPTLAAYPPFTPGTAYEWTAALTIDRLTTNVLADIWRYDARYLGLIGPRLLQERFSNLSEYDPNGNANRVRAVTMNGEIWRVVAAAKGKAASCLPSSAEGVGREFDQVDFDQQRQAFVGYIVIDTSRLPIIRVYGIAKAIVDAHGWDKHIPRPIIDSWFIGFLTPVIQL